VYFIFHRLAVVVVVVFVAFVAFVAPVAFVAFVVLVRIFAAVLRSTNRCLGQSRLTRT
jgi:hypothetical protein